MTRALARTVLIGLALAWAVFLAFLVRQEAARARGEVPDFVRYPYLDAGTCRRCHEGAWEAWARSPHARALSSLEPRNMSAADKVGACLPCHAPEPVLLTGLGEAPLPRETRRREGVGCATCHLAEGGMAGASAGARGACRPVYTPALTSVDLCRSCHNAHGTVDQWEASSFAARGVDCRGCHMPGKDHEMLGAHDSATLRAAVELDARVEGRRLQVAVTNRGAGHNVPSGRRSRSMELVVDFAPSGGQERYRFRNPFKGEGGENTQLPSGETRSLDWPLPSGPGTARVRLIFQFRPGQADEDGVLMQERRVEFGS